MVSTLQKLLIPTFGYCDSSIPLLKHFIEDPPHKYFESLSILNQYSQIDVSYSAYIEIKFCSYNRSSNFNFYLWNGVLLPYSGIFSRTINFAVFVDFTATSKINPPKSYYSIKCNDSLVDPRNLICEMYH